MEVNTVNSISQVVQFHSFIFSNEKSKFSLKTVIWYLCMWKFFAENLLNTVSLHLSIHLSTSSTLIINYLAIFFSDNVIRYI